MRIEIQADTKWVDDRDPSKGVCFGMCEVTKDCRDCGEVNFKITAAVYELAEKLSRLRWNVTEGTEVIDG